jgi:catechol 2,3-dioxygenase-like lactoylglutathione lyase family enzyme
MRSRFLTTTVVLPARDARETAQFYHDKLGFEIVGVWEVAHSKHYASVRREGVVIEFGEGRQVYAGTGVCMIHVDSATAIYQEYKQNPHIDFVADFANREYGNRDFRIRDNNGNMLIIGETLKNRDELLEYNRIL